MRRHATRVLGVFSVLLALSSCRISYKFTGTSIDYDQTKTVSISEFINQAPLVYPPLSQTFTEALRELFRRQTRLEEVAQAGDFSIEGAIPCCGAGRCLCFHDSVYDDCLCTLRE